MAAVKPVLFPSPLCQKHSGMPCELSRWRLCIGQPSAGDNEGQNEKEKESEAEK